MDHADRPLLNDPNQIPDDLLLGHHLGRAKAAWDVFTCGIAEGFPDASLEWRYYKDGGAWLCKLTRRKKTVCWISVWDKLFKVAFYVTAKSAADIEHLDIAPELKAAYRTNAATGKLKALRIEVKSKKQLSDLFTLMNYKCSLK